MHPTEKIRPEGLSPHTAPERQPAPQEPLFVGVDGGGTKTELLLCRQDGQILARCRTAGCNPNDMGLEPAFAVLEAGIRRLLELGGAEERAVVSLFAGLSGGSTGDLQPRIARLLRRSFPRIGRLENGSDAVNILTAGLGPEEGCAVICGTGSACFVRVEGAVHRIGGWGYLLDRYGSGYDIGRDAVIAALRQQDGRGAATLLTPLLEEALGRPVPQAVSALYEGGKRLLASFAPLVFRAEKEGDRVAGEILDRNMEELAGLINAAGRLFGPSPVLRSGEGTAPAPLPGDGGEGPALRPFPAVLAGGIFANGRPVTGRLARFLTVPARLRPLEVPPVWGAVYQAFVQLGLPLPQRLWDPSERP